MALVVYLMLAPALAVPLALALALATANKVRSTKWQARVGICLNLSRRVESWSRSKGRWCRTLH